MKGSEKKKIKDLFEYRKLPYLLSYLPKKDAKKLYKKLVRLQYEIYRLDAYLEKNWVLKKKRLSKRWDNIYLALDELGYNKKDSFKILGHIRKYEKHESQLRKGVMPTVLNDEYYYYYKSCDVRLMRHIIYDHCPEISSDIAFEDWRYFDLITEVNDDVEDVFEDQKTINGNMFLIAIIESGLTETEKRFRNFIENLEKKETNSVGISNDQTAQRKKILKWSISESEKTKQLLMKNIGRIKRKGLKSNIRLIKYGALSN